MDHLNFERLFLSCNQDGLIYFPSGHREILRCQLIASNGIIGLTEWAPINIIHEHSIEKVIELLSLYNQMSIDGVLSHVSNNNVDYLSHYFKTSFPYPISFIFSLALYYAQNRNFYSSIPINLKPILLVLPHHSCEYVQTMFQRGYRHFKIKIGSDPNHEIERIKRIRFLFGHDVSLRLDANKQLSFIEAATLLKAIKSETILYIEEPLDDVTRLSELRETTGVDIALDESMCEENLWDMCCLTKSNYIIIKASRFNNIYSVINICKKAQYLGVSPIFSSCFEAELYCSLISCLVDKLKLLNHAHGITTEIWA